MERPTTNATYVGDGVYVEFDGYHVWLFTQRENGWHSIALEIQVWQELVAFVQPIFGVAK